MARLNQDIEATMRLIELVRDNRVLWDTHSDEYHKRDKRTLAEEKISNEIEIDVKTFKSKWHNIRSYYSKELKKIKDSTRSGAGSEDVYKPKWPFYEIVDSFLRPTVMPRSTSSNMEAVNSPTASNIDIEEDADDLSELVDDDYLSDTDVASGNQSLIAPKRTAAPRLNPKGKKKKGDVDDPIKVATAALKDISKSPDGKDKGNELEDDDALFGKLVASGIRKITDPRTKEFTKLQIQNLIFSAQFPDPYPSHRPTMVTQQAIPTSHEMQVPCVPYGPT